MTTPVSRRNSFQLPRFYPILDTIAAAERECPIITAAESLLEAGVQILQFRHKGNWTQDRFDEAKQIASLCREAGTLFVLNDRADFACLLDAALHIGQDDLQPVAARHVVPNAVIGFSTHNALQLRRGNDEPVDYLAVGPVFQTTSKLKPDPVLGLDGLRALRPLTSKPVVAIGGISLDNAAQVFEAKADSVAVISGILPDQCTRVSLARRAHEWLQLAC